MSVFSVYFYKNLNKLDYGSYLEIVFFLKSPLKDKKKEKKNVRLWLIETAPGAGTSTPCFFDTSGFLKEASDQKLE